MAKRTAAGALGKGKPIARKSAGGMLRTITGAKGSAVAKRSPGGSLGTISRAKGTAVVRKAAAGTTRTYRAKSAVARQTVTTRKLESGAVKPGSVEQPKYQGPVYLGRKRSSAIFLPKPEIIGEARRSKWQK